MFFKIKLKPLIFAEMNIPADNFYEREYYTEEEAITMWNYRKEE